MFYCALCWWLIIFLGKKVTASWIISKMAVNSDFRLCAVPGGGRRESREHFTDDSWEIFHQILSKFLLSTGRKRTCSICEKGQRYSPCTLPLKIYWKRSSRGHKPLFRKPQLQHFFPGVSVVSVVSCYSLLLPSQFFWGVWGWADQLSMKEPYWILWLCKWEKLWTVTETED